MLISERTKRLDTFFNSDNFVYDNNNDDIGIWRWIKIKQPYAIIWKNRKVRHFHLWFFFIYNTIMINTFSLNWLKSKLRFYTKIMLGMGIKIYFSMSYAKTIYYIGHWLLIFYLITINLSLNIEIENHMYYQNWNIFKLLFIYNYNCGFLKNLFYALVNQLYTCTEISRRYFHVFYMAFCLFALNLIFFSWYIFTILVALHFIFI